MPDPCAPPRTPPAAPSAGSRPLSTTFSPTRIPEEPVFGRWHGEAFNIDHTKEISIDDLAMLVNSMTQSPSEIVFALYEQAYKAGFEHMPRRAPDISKIHGLIGYRPVRDLPEMPERVIAYERDRGGERARTCRGLSRLGEGLLRILPKCRIINEESGDA
jgi:hypothetical protein